MGCLITEIRKIIYILKEKGEIVGNTKEIIGWNFSVFNVNIEEFKIQSKEFFPGIMNKYNQEKYHYKALRYILRQKMEYIRFYFKEEAIFSRKLVAHSEDCISCVQILPRKNKMDVCVYMRSSEVEKLLITDILGILLVSEWLRGKIYRAFFLEEIIINLHVSIGSAHYYPVGDKRREE